MESIEEKYVLKTYNKIAKSFDKTRIMIWKCVIDFISTLNKNTSVLEVGCGNGKNIKYLLQNGFTNVSGCDISPEFVTICLAQNLNVIEANMTNLPYLDNSVENIICIAVLHHLSMQEYRVNAIRELLRIVKENGRILLTVASYEFPFSKKIKLIHPDNYSDVLISWDLPQTKNIADRYYHLFKQNELEELCILAGVIHFESFFEHDNWGIIITKDLS